MCVCVCVWSLDESGMPWYLILKFRVETEQFQTRKFHRIIFKVYFYYSFSVFTLVLTGGLYWNPSDSKSLWSPPQDLLIILAGGDGDEL